MRKHTRGQVDCAVTRARVLKQASEGAYRKAIDSITTEVASFTREENANWASVLHPASKDKEAAIFVVPSSTTESSNVSADNIAEATRNDQHPLRGIHFGALKGANPSGTRPEHISELLGVSWKRIAARAFSALGMPMDKIEHEETNRGSALDDILQNNVLEEEVCINHDRSRWANFCDQLSRNKFLRIMDTDFCMNQGGRKLTISGSVRDEASQ